MFYKSTTSPSKWQKFWALAAGCLVNLLIGSYYNFGNINGPISTYFGLEPSTTLLVLPLWLFCQSGSTTFSIAVADKFGYRTMNCIAFLAFAGVNLAVSFLPRTTTGGYLFIVIYGVGNGVTIGSAYLLSLYIAWTYFEGRLISTVTGFILFFSGVAAMILGPVTNMVVNPDGIIDDTDERVAKNVPWLFQFMSMYFLGLTVVCTLVQPPVCTSSQLAAKKQAQKAQKKTAGQPSPRNGDYVNEHAAVKPDTGSSQAKNLLGTPDISAQRRRVNSNELALSQGCSVGFQLDNPGLEQCREDLAIIQKADLG